MKYAYYIKLLFLFLMLLSLSACESNQKDYQILLDEEMDKLLVYLEENNIDTEPTSSGLYYIEIEEGDGQEANYGDYVYVAYKGYFLDGEAFDEADETNPFGFTLSSGSVIRGWVEGVSMMRERGKAKLIIPSTLAYGAYGYSDVPPFSTLIFDIELIQVD